MRKFEINSSAVLTARYAAGAAGRDWRAASGTYKGADGIERRRMVKDVMRVGKFVHPRDGYEFDVTPAILANWETQFARMKANGVKVNIPVSHEAADDSTANRGWVTDLFRDGETLFAEIELVGPDAIRDAARNDVSIFSPPLFRDGAGNEYPRPITHIALVPDPVIPGLGDFIPIAAARGMMQSTKGDAMLTEYQKKIAAALGMSADEIAALTAANFEEATAKFADAKAAAAEKEKADKAAADAAAEAAKAEDDSAAGGTPEAKIAASRGKRKPDPLVVKTIAASRSQQIDALQRCGELNKAAADKLRAKYCTADSVSLALSRGDDGSDFDSAIEIVKANAARTLDADGRERTGPQIPADALELSRGGPATNPLLADAERRAKAHNERYAGSAR